MNAKKDAKTHHKSNSKRSNNKILREQMLRVKAKGEDYYQKYKRIKQNRDALPESNVVERTLLLELNIKLEKQYMKLINEFYRLRWIYQEKKIKKARKKMTSSNSKRIRENQNSK